MLFKLIGLIYYALAIIAVVEIAQSSKSLGMKVVWICGILMFPPIGLLVYFFMGRG